MDLVDFFPYYPSVDDENLQAAIFQKKEFYENRLGAQDRPLFVDGKTRLRQQIIIERFFSGYTPYDEGLIYHAMGTGKTCAAFSVSEFLKKKGVFKRCIVMAAGSDSLDNLRRELITKCGSYESNEKGLSPEEKMRQSRRLVKKFYRFETYYSFAKDCSQLSDENVVKFYNNTIFIVDEAHNVLTQQEEKQGRVLVYENLFRAFHLIQQRKILLLTGTPMRNNVNEFALLMNLILPKEKQLVDFEQSFFVEKADGTLEVNTNKELILKEILRGRVSYLTDPKFDVKVEWLGRPQKGYADIPQFRSLDLEMSKFQTRAYVQAYKSDTSGARGEFYLNSIQASLFVFPDGSWGEEGRAKFCKDDAFIDSLKNDDALRKYSVKYFHAVKKIEENRSKNVFIYCSAVQGSGVETLTMILRRRGFTRFGLNELQSFGKRYMVLTSKTKNIGALVKEFNHPRNKNGEFCQVIIGSRKIAEGYSFKNIQIEMLLTQHWNEAETSQASRRGARFGSWDAFKRKDGTIPSEMYLEISKVCAVPSDSSVQSVDKFMIQVSLMKDFSIKRLDRVIKEAAFDCPLTFERNFDPRAKEGSRECDYGKCEYKCDFGEEEDVEGGSDLTTYEIYYEQYLDLVPRITKLFRRRDTFSIDTLSEIIRPNSMTQLIKALVYMIENNVSVANRFGLSCYLREFSNTYYLTPDISTPTNSMEFCFPARPVFSHRVSIDRFIEKKSAAGAIAALRELDEAKTESDFAGVLERLEPEVIDIVVKLSAKEKVAGRVNTFCKVVLQQFKARLFFEKKEDYLAVYKDTSDTTWCLQKNYEWKICVAKKTKSPQKERSERPEEAGVEEFRARVEKVGFEGIREGDKFCIRKVQPEDIKDKRKATTGSVCRQAGWKKPQLLDIISQLKIKNVSEKDNKDVLCEEIEKAFKKRGILRTGKCGTARKKKEQV